MSQENTRRFQGEIEKTVDYFRCEYELTLAEAVGTLDVIKHKLLHDDQDDQEEDEGDLTT